MNPYGVLAGTIGLVAVGWLVFRKVRADYRHYGQLTQLSVFLEFLIFAMHGCASYLFLDSNLSDVQMAGFIFWLAVCLMAIGLSGVLTGMARLSWMKVVGDNLPFLVIIDPDHEVVERKC